MHDARHPPMQEKVMLVVSLFIHEGREAEFEEFESAAAGIMRRHGGAIERRIGAGSPVAGQPYEVHIVTFPNRRLLETYRGDPDLKALANLRARAIRDTIVWIGEDLPNFKLPTA